MFYFKFKDKYGAELYASINVDNVDKATPEQKQAFFEELKKICKTDSIDEVSKEEYETETE